MSAAPKLALGALAACACVLAALTLHGLREDPAAPAATRAPTAVAATSVVETPPWSPSLAPASAPLPGTVPVAYVDPPRPDPAMPLPPAQAIEPANPALHRPPMDNPGGVDGDRPARAVPGLD